MLGLVLGWVLGLVLGGVFKYCFLFIQRGFQRLGVSVAAKQNFSMKSVYPSNRPLCFKYSLTV